MCLWVLILQPIGGSSPSCYHFFTHPPTRCYFAIPYVAPHIADASQLAPLFRRTQFLGKLRKSRGAIRYPFVRHRNRCCGPASRWAMTVHRGNKSRPSGIHNSLQRCLHGNQSRPGWSQRASCISWAPRWRPLSTLCLWFCESCLGCRENFLKWTKFDVSAMH